MQSHDNSHIRKRAENTTDETREEAHKLRRAEDGHKIDSVVVSEQTELIDKEKNENLDDGKNEEVDNRKKEQAKAQVQEKHPVVKFEEEFLEKNGYEQLSHFPVTDEIRALIGNHARPVGKLNLPWNEFICSSGLTLRHHLSSGQDNSFYICHSVMLYKQTLSDLVQKSFKKLKPGRFIYDLVLVTNDKGEWELNLRIIISGDAGHPGLLVGDERGATPICLVAAGEGYYFPHLGGIIMMNDKTGKYHEYLRETGINPEPIIEAILSKYYAPEYKKDASGAKKDCFYHTVTDQRPLVEELIKRGLPYSLVPKDIVEPTINEPKDLLKRIPFESLSKEVQEISEVNQQKYDAYLGAHQHPDNNNVPTGPVTSLSRASNTDTVSIEPAPSKQGSEQPPSPHRAQSIFPPAKKDEVSDTDSPQFTSAPTGGRLG